jgi:hypothetical protein
MLIIIVSLSSLVMKVSSRLGLNASMFLAAVLIHWRVADEIPLVAYATFLDFFMIITYGTLVMVLVSGILIMKFTELKDEARVDLVYRWSIRIIPALAIVLYARLSSLPAGTRHHLHPVKGPWTFGPAPVPVTLSFPGGLISPLPHGPSGSHSARPRR